VLGHIGDAEAQRDLIDEQRLGQVQPQRAEVVAGGEDDLVLADFECGAFEQRLVAAAIVVGDACARLRGARRRGDLR
jgi:hypothetical protein